MKLSVYNFGNPNDVRKAIDLLNSLIADCMVSEKWLEINIAANVPSHVKPDEGILENLLDEMLEIRERTVTYWLSLHYALHRAIDERQPSEATVKYFDLMWSMFDHSRTKVLAFMKKTVVPHHNFPDMRKRWYGKKHYFTMRDLEPDIGKPLLNMLSEHEDREV